MDLMDIDLIAFAFGVTLDFFCWTLLLDFIVGLFCWTLLLDFIVGLYFWTFLLDFFQSSYVY